MDGNDPGTPAAGPARKGRGAVSNPSGRYETERRGAFDDGWGTMDEEAPPLVTSVVVDSTRTVITTNDSPDIGFERSINPYRGCEHGCIYCYARPTHAYLGLSPGLDFESRLFAKPEAPRILESELRKKGYLPKLIALGTNTDPYQPIEREFRITRGLLEVLARFRHPVGIVTKSNLILRDLDILSGMAREGLVSVMLSVTTLDRSLARRMEPRAPTPERRLEAVRALAAAGIPTGVLVAPIIPGINDAGMESVLAASREAGARSAGYVLLRLPLELKDLFGEWLATHFPERAAKVLALIRQTRAGALNQAAYGTRMRGTGPVADLLSRRFRVAKRRLGFASEPAPDASRFRVPPAPGSPLPLFDEDER